MKVTTDACLFGAWVASIIKRENAAQNILDIGTGTGLLSLMLAQKSNAQITAVELEEKAYRQASSNISSSLWGNRIKVIKGDVKEYKAERLYDCIICNPPFYENELRSPGKEINMARHDESFKLDELLRVVDKGITSDGKAAILLPYHRAYHFEEMARGREFFVIRKATVRQTTSHNYFRAMVVLSKKESNSEVEEVVIKDPNGNYSPEFTALLKDYYLYL